MKIEPKQFFEKLVKFYETRDGLTYYIDDIEYAIHIIAPSSLRIFPKNHREQYYSFVYGNPHPSGKDVRVYFNGVQPDAGFLCVTQIDVQGDKVAIDLENGHRVFFSVKRTMNLKRQFFNEQRTGK